MFRKTLTIIKVPVTGNTADLSAMAGGVILSIYGETTTGNAINNPAFTALISSRPTFNVLADRLNFGDVTGGGGDFTGGLVSFVYVGFTSNAPYIITFNVGHNLKYVYLMMVNNS